MNEFDDPGMERLLGGAAGGHPDVEAALGRVRGRVRVIRRRRAVLASTTACLLLAGGALYVLQDGSRTDLEPAGTISLPDGTGSTDLDGSTSIADGGGGNDGGGGTSVAPGGPTSSPGVPDTTPGTTPGSVTPGVTTTTSVPGTQRSYTSLGGSIVVRLTGDSLVLLSTDPADGFTVESSTTTATRVEVRFTNGSGDTRIRIDLVDGEMVPTIDDNV